jgi:hypothetical protein
MIKKYNTFHEIASFEDFDSWANRVSKELTRLSPYSIENTVNNEVKTCDIDSLKPHEGLNVNLTSSISSRDKVGDFYPWRENWRAPRQRRWDHYYPQEWDRYSPYDYNRKLTEKEKQEAQEAQEKILEQIKKWKEPKQKKEDVNMERRVNLDALKLGYTNQLNIGTEKYSLRSNLGGVLWPAIHLSETYLEIGIPGLTKSNVDISFRKIHDPKGNESLELIISFLNNKGIKDDIMSKYVDFEKYGNPDSLSMTFIVKGFVSVLAATVEDGVLTLTLEQAKPIQNTLGEYSKIQVG